MTDPLTRRSDDPLTTPDPAATPDATGLREAVEALHAELSAFDALDGAIPSHVDVPDDYEAGIVHAAGRLGSILAAHTTPDTTGLRERLATIAAETFYTGHGWSWADDELDPADRATCIEEMLPVADALLADLAAHPTPDASPDPAVVLAEHDDPPGWMWSASDQMVYSCECGDHYVAGAIDVIQEHDVVAAAAWHRAHVAQALAAACFGDVRAIEAEWDRASAGRDLWRQSHALMRQRAEAAEKELADLRERVEALAADWDDNCPDAPAGTSCVNHDHADELRAALIPGAGEDRG